MKRVPAPLAYLEVFTALKHDDDRVHRHIEQIRLPVHAVKR